MATDNINKEIELRELLSILFNKKKFIFIFTLFSAVISVSYSLSLPNIYTSSSLLAPKSEDDSLSSQVGSFSGLAGLAGINMTKNASKSQEAIERIQSYDFFLMYFIPNIEYQNLVAVEEWVPEKNILKYDSTKFDIETKKWKIQKKPSYQTGFKKYKKMLSISEFVDTNFVSISIEHKSPIIAKEWVEIIVLNINESMREVDKQDAKNAINFLNETSKSTSIMSIKEIISKLLENQMQTLMLASSKDDYIFRTIDSPYIPEEKSRPSRALVCIIGTSLVFLIAILIVLCINYMRPFKNE